MSSNLGEVIKDKLYEGQIVKNKQELFRMLGLNDSKEKTIKGKQMKLYEAKLAAYMNYESYKGNSIRILDIYEEPFEIIDKRREGIYVTYIETILLNYLLIQNNMTLDITYSQLFCALGMANHNYLDEDIRKKLKSIDHRITKFEEKDFFLRSYSQMKRIVDRALQSLELRSKISYSKHIVINNRDEYPNDIEQCEKHIANNIETREILQTETEVLKEMEARDRGQIFWRGKSSAFYSRVNEILSEKHNWFNYYNEIRIVMVGKDYLKYAIEENIISMKKQLLNQNVHDIIDRDAVNKYNRQEKRIRDEWEFVSDGGKNFNTPIGLASDYSTYKKLWLSKNIGYPNDYVEIQKLLSDIFISIVPNEQKEFFEYVATHQIEPSVSEE